MCVSFQNSIILIKLNIFTQESFCENDSVDVLTVKQVLLAHRAYLCSCHDTQCCQLFLQRIYQI